MIYKITGIQALYEFCSAVMYRQERIRNMNAYLMNIITRQMEKAGVCQYLFINPSFIVKLSYIICIFLFLFQNRGGRYSSFNKNNRNNNNNNGNNNQNNNRYNNNNQNNYGNNNQFGNNNQNNQFTIINIKIPTKI